MFYCTLMPSSGEFAADPPGLRNVAFVAIEKNQPPPREGRNGGNGRFCHARGKNAVATGSRTAGCPKCRVLSRLKRICLPREGLNGSVWHTEKKCIATASGD